MLFDEDAILGGPLEDAQHIKTSSPKKATLNKPDILSNRSKTIDKPSLASRPRIVERYSSEESPKIKSAKVFDVDALLRPPSNSNTNVMMIDEAEKISDNTNPLSSQEYGFKVDSKHDFVSTYSRL